MINSVQAIVAQQRVYGAQLCCLLKIDLSIELTKDLNLFNIKKMKGDYKRDYYRLRKGKYRAIIEEFEKNEKEGKVSFNTIEEIIKK